VKWRIYYEDGGTFSDEDGSPKEAPGWGVQTIVQPHIESGRYLLPPYDYYLFRDGRWIGVDVAGLTDHLLKLGVLRLNRDTRQKEWKLWFGGWREIDMVDLLLNVVEEGIAKIGTLLTKERHMEIFNAAQADKDFPARTAYRAREWRPEQTESR
jgi:hypothetical protein